MFVQNPNTNRYRCLSFLLAGMMAVTSLPLPAFAADAAAGEEIAISAERFPDEQFGTTFPNSWTATVTTCCPRRNAAKSLI